MLAHRRCRQPRAPSAAQRLPSAALLAQRPPLTSPPPGAAAPAPPPPGAPAPPRGPASPPCAPPVQGPGSRRHKQGQAGAVTTLWDSGAGIHRGCSPSPHLCVIAFIPQALRSKLPAFGRLQPARPSNSQAVGNQRQPSARKRLARSPAPHSAPPLPGCAPAPPPAAPPGRSGSSAPPAGAAAAGAAG